MINASKARKGSLKRILTDDNNNFLNKVPLYTCRKGENQQQRTKMLFVQGYEYVYFLL